MSQGFFADFAKLTWFWKPRFRKTNAARASHPTASLRGFLPAVVADWRRNDRFSPTALESSAASAKARCRSVILRSRICTRNAGQQPSCSEEHEWGRRPQRPGNQSRSRAFSGFPPAIHSRESPLPLALPQSSGKLRNSHVSHASTLSQIVAHRNTKTAHLVKKLWRMRLPCGS